MRLSLGAFVVAGICGAIICSNLPESKDWADYKGRKIGPWGLAIATYVVWATVEHLAFWIGILLPVAIALVRPGALA